MPGDRGLVEVGRHQVVEGPIEVRQRQIDHQPRDRVAFGDRPRAASPGQFTGRRDRKMATGRS